MGHISFVACFLSVDKLVSTKCIYESTSRVHEFLTCTHYHQQEKQTQVFPHAAKKSIQIHF